MSLSMTGEVKQDVVEPAKGMIKCRIPQRMGSARQKPPLNKPKPPYEVFGDMGEKKSRAKSANRVKDDLSIGRPAHPAPRSARPAAPDSDRFPNTTTIHIPAKMPKKVNVVRQTGKLIRSIMGIPDTELQLKEAISKEEEIPLRSEDLDYLNHCTAVTDKESTISCSQSEKLKKLKMSCQQNEMQFVKMKNDLSERQKPKCEAVPVQQRSTKSPARARSNESRPKSASRVKDDLSIGRPAHPAPRSARPAERDRFPNTTRRPSTIPRKINDIGQTNKPVIRSIITVPVAGPLTQRAHSKSLKLDLPDQEAISKQEKVSFKSDDLDDSNRGSPIITDKDSTLCYTQSDKMMKLKMNWQQNVMQFEKMKGDLNERQKAIVELYAFMRNTHAKMKSLGQKAILPPPEDLRIMNVAKLSAEQLLQLCSSVRPDDQLPRAGQPKDLQMSHKPLAIDMNKLFAMPSKLVATCEQTLFKRKEIIDWFETLRSEEKGIGMNKLAKKINEFNAENEMLKCSLEQAKGEFIKELNEIIEFMRKSINETVALQLRAEELTYTLSELNSQNADLRKQIHNAEHLRPNTTKAKVEALEKELKGERSKTMSIKERLSRYEGQIKISAERASQLEAALEQALSQTWNLERKVQQLNEQNQTLQSEFDELNKLRESIRENTMHLELIAEARVKLQTEKEDLVKRLEDLSNSYNESLLTIKQEMNASVSKVIEAEKKYEDLVEEKKSVEVNLESYRSQLLESELRVINLTKELQETKNNLSHAMSFEIELSATKRDLDIAVIEIEDYRKKVAGLNDTIKEYENNIKESINLEEELKSNLINKEKYINDLEKQQSLLENQLQESESKMGSYQEQLACLKINIAELQEDFGEFENLNELHGMINQQRAKLLEATRLNGELAEALHKKDIELGQHMETITEQEQLLAQRNGLIKMLSNKDEEHTNIIKLLRNNLEMRNQADMDLNQQITEKNSEINTLLTNVETRKQQISQLEKIILTLEDQMHKVSMQRRKDQDKFDLLENKIKDYEQYHMEPRRNELPSNNIDSIIKILEDELGTPFDPSLKNKEHDFVTPKRDRRRENFECHNVNNNQTMYPNEHETVPTKIVMGNFKTYISSNDEQYRSDKLDRKKAITNIDTQKWIQAPEPINVFAVNTPTIRDSNYPPFRGLLPASSHLKDNLLSRNIQLLANNQLRDEKNSKMLKIAGHKL